MPRFFQPLRHLFFALAATLPSLPTAAQDTCPPPLEVAAPKVLEQLARNATDRGFLWTFEKNGQVSYLYGTLHAQKLAWFGAGPQLRTALKSAHAVALEMDPSDATLQASLIAAQPDGAAANVLPERMRMRLQARMAAECVDPTTLQNLSPELQVTMLSLLAARRDGLEVTYGSELALAYAARAMNKPVFSLESAADQMRALTPSSTAERNALMDRSLTALSDGSARRVLAQAADYWASSNGDALARYTEWCECTHTDAERAQLKRLLDERNPQLADRMAALQARTGSLLTGVGALHMFGPNNLPDLLRQRGYVVTRVH
ncbi:TraB/GumN family protein [Ottowia sp.]|uniref:TraB/GumN family protein n=1 Tax=Ottowia sp. TaxID=1898956 RepID=UPI003A8A69AF